MAKVFNLVEGIFWISIGACFLVSLVRPARRRVKVIAAATIAASCENTNLPIGHTPNNTCLARFIRDPLHPDAGR